MARPTLAQLEAQLEMARTTIAAHEATIADARRHYVELRRAARLVHEEVLKLRAECKRKENIIQMLRKRPTRREFEELKTVRA